jgi:hypothetical protein
MRSRVLWLLAMGVPGLAGCAFDFDSVCREGEVCEPVDLPLPPDREPNVGQVPGCGIFSGTCGEETSRTACSFRITGDAVDAPPECRASSGSTNENGICDSASFCSFGLTCWRPSVDATATCIDLCRTVADCRGVERTCDRSAPVATLDGVPVYRCVQVSD